jgi:hypothetical protein
MSVRGVVSVRQTVRQRADGSLTLSPRALRALALPLRQEWTVLPMGKALMLIPNPSVVLESSQTIAKILAEEGVTREELLVDLADERQQYNRERYPELYG